MLVASYQRTLGKVPDERRPQFNGTVHQIPRNTVQPEPEQILISGLTYLFHCNLRIGLKPSTGFLEFTM